jgi:hypothetical protein
MWITPMAIKLPLKSLMGTNWVNVGTAGFSDSDVLSTSLALDGSGTPYVALWMAPIITKLPLESLMAAAG